MTNEEATSYLEMAVPVKALTKEEFHKFIEALNIAFRALEQEPCEDAISREELLKAIYTWDKFGCDADNKLVQYQDHYIPYIHYDDVVKCIKGMPSVNTQKIGHWIENAPEYQNIDPPYICSECGNMHLRKTNYCDQCGARMVEPQESEE